MFEELYYLGCIIAFLFFLFYLFSLIMTYNSKYSINLQKIGIFFDFKKGTFTSNEPPVLKDIVYYFIFYCIGYVLLSWISVIEVLIMYPINIIKINIKNKKNKQILKKLSDNILEYDEIIKCIELIKE